MSNAMTLVLNRNFMAIDVATWERAVSLLFQGAAEAVDENCRCYNFTDWAELSQMMKEHPAGFVHSVNMRLAIPDVIKLTQYDRIPRNDVVFTRRNILDHYGYRCCYCGKKFSAKDLNFDHVIPRSKGGKTNWDNIVASCYKCNSRKDDMTLKEAGMKLLVHPSRPKHQPVMKRLVVSLPFKTRMSWQKFLDKAYWNVPLDQD